MASPISFGDAYTMAKIAYRLGRAFTKGRKSAPAEFQEVENQLYALSAALESLKKATDKGEIRGESGLDPDNDPITIMLANCNETLSHLDNLVKEYGRLSSTGVESTGNEPAFTRIGKKIKRNWQTIQWTTEGGDLATLRSQLILHTNCLGLVLGAVNNTRTAKMSTQVSESAEILQKLYQLFLANTENSEVQNTVVQPGVEAQDGPAIIYFRLQADNFVCNRAALRLLDRSMDQPRDKQSNVFQCHCSHHGTASTELHTDQVSALTFSPSSFPVRLSGNPRSWIVYKMKNRDTHQLQNLTIRSSNLKYMSRFEEDFVDQLAIRKAQELLQQGINTTVAHLSPAADSVRVLSLLGNTSSTQFIDSITFSSDTRSFTRDAIASVNLFHYKSLPTRHVADDAVQSSQISYDNCAELVFHYKTKEGISKDISKSIVYSTDAFQLKLREMQVDLFAISHLYPRSDESLLLHLQADEILFEDLHIENGIIDIVVSRTNNQHRLIIRSENGYAALSQELPEDFISSLEQGAPPDMSAPTCEIRMQERDGAVYRQVRKRDGLGRFHISVAATYNNPLLELGLLTLTS
ncbi:uncharacterized protein BKA55DRAFT_542022 [Fusarium redolens]|uniref:Fungal N-terminal domain-containing protein n=1 Tax=Fusarium redolens TaxID=48865 RepID=A0A9P9GJH1_FUSRE|nr:uncharacterized protein BKA55DRAFT_542022 [Fusarium redolens]KAH7240709.1 hypothetical protein BKA55DRAFT_542022 [Fusarium redolens]